MLYAIIMGAIVLFSPVILLKLEVPLKKMHSIFIDTCGAVTFVSFMLIMSWVDAATKHAEPPTFELWPIAIVGFLSLISALRANKTYKDRYVTTPASS